MNCLSHVWQETALMGQLLLCYSEIDRPSPRFCTDDDKASVWGPRKQGEKNKHLLSAYSVPGLDMFSTDTI